MAGLAAGRSRQSIRKLVDKVNLHRKGCLKKAALFAFYYAGIIQK